MPPASLRAARRAETDPVPARRALTRREKWALLAIVALGLLVRIPRLAESLWYDEIAAWLDYGVHGPRQIVTTYYDPANQIGHTLLTWVSVTIAGGRIDEALALRLPALLFSLASIPLLFALGRRVAGGRVGLLAALLGAVAPVAVLEGAEARAYSMMIFFSAAATWQILRAMDGKGLGNWMGYAALCALGIYAHLAMVFLPLGQGLWICWQTVRHRLVDLPARAILGLLATATLTAALYAPVAPEILRVRRTFLATDGNEPSPLGTEGLHTLLQLGGSWSWWAALPGLLLALFGLVLLAREARGRRVAGLALLGLPAMVMALTLAGSWMYARFALFALPGALLLMAVALADLWKRDQRVGLAAVAVLGACFALDLGTRPAKQPLRDAAATVQAAAPAGEPVVVVGLARGVLGVYAGDLAMSFSLHHGSDLREKLDAVDPNWVIVMYPRSVPDERYDLLDERGFVLVERHRGWVDWGNGDVLVYERPAR